MRTDRDARRGDPYPVQRDVVAMRDDLAMMQDDLVALQDDRDVRQPHRDVRRDGRDVMRRDRDFRNPPGSTRLQSGLLSPRPGFKMIVMWPEDGDDDEFDFEAWATRSAKPPFGACAKMALESLALGKDDLRVRLRLALYCFLYADRTTVPSVCLPMYDEVAQFVRERLGEDRSSAALGRLVKKMKIRTAQRLSRRIVAIYETVVTGRAVPRNL